MKNVESKARWFIKLHRRMIKPPYPVNINCPACGRWLVRVNSDLIELNNDFGLQPRELKASDRWTQTKHSCGAKITLYWKD